MYMENIIRSTWEVQQVSPTAAFVCLFVNNEKKLMEENYHLLTKKQLEREIVEMNIVIIVTSVSPRPTNDKL